MYSQRSIANLVSKADPLVILESLGVQITSVTKYEVRAPCPLHKGDNETAFCFNRDTKQFTCFTSNCCSGKKRDVITFLMEYRALSFMESVRYVSSLCNIPIEEDEDRIKGDSELSYIDQLTNYLGSSNKYLEEGPLKEIKINNYFKDGWGHVESYLKTRNMSLKEVEEFSLYPGIDRYKHLRLFIPFRDDNGRLVGYSGRIMDTILSYPSIKSKGYIRKPSKYENNKGFKKGRILYNLNIAKNYCKESPLIIVEGQFDAIRMSLYGYKNTVAILGSVLSDNQANLIYKHSTSVILLVEDVNKKDKNGEIITLKHMKSNIDKLTERNCTVKSAFLEKDPDSTTKEQIEYSLNNAKEVINGIGS